MAKFHFTVTVAIYLSAFVLLCSSASLSPSKSPKKFSATIAPSPGKVVRTSPPEWLQHSLVVQSTHHWNAFGQWFDQRTSKPERALMHLNSVPSVNDFWSIVSPSELESIERINLSLFRPGFSPDFATLMDLQFGYILSYKISSDMLTKPSPSKLSRNQAKKLKDSGCAPSQPEHFLRAFDPVMEAVMNPQEPSAFSSDVFGFTIKRQYEHTFFQVFINSINIPYRDALIKIREIISEAFPTVALGSSLNIWLPRHAAKITGSPLDYSKFSPRSPTKTVAAFSPRENESESKSESENESAGENEGDYKYVDDIKSNDDQSIEAEQQQQSTDEPVTTTLEESPVISPIDMIITEFNNNDENEDDYEALESCEDVSFEDFASQARSGVNRSRTVDDIIDMEDEHYSEDGFDKESDDFEEEEDERAKNETTFQSKLSHDAPIFIPAYISIPDAFEPLESLQPLEQLGQMPPLEPITSTVTESSNVDIAITENPDIITRILNSKIVNFDTYRFGQLYDFFEAMDKRANTEKDH